MGDHGVKAGRLFVVSAPSGAGKTTLVKRLVTMRPGLRFSVSYTTRPQRSGEVDERDYFFVDETRFAAMRDAGDFLEHACVFGHRYGTSRAQVQSLLDAGHDVLLEIDWQGARQVRANLPACISVFILPPSVAELERRLRGRGTDTAAVIEGRLSEAVGDMAHWQEFDYAVVNDDLEAAVAELCGILDGEGAACATTNPSRRARIETLLAGRS
jgi:guanylate kinase